MDDDALWQKRESRNEQIFLALTIKTGMGNVWSIFHDDKQLFNKSAYLSYTSSSNGTSGRRPDGGISGYSSRFAFYQAMQQAVTRMQLAKIASTLRGTNDGDMEGDDRVHVNFMLAHWPRELDVVYDRIEDFPFTIPIRTELSAPPSTSEPSPESHPAPVTTHEEAVLKGLSENQLSSSEAIHQAIKQLSQKVRDNDTLLRILAKYPRATRLYVSQQLHACSDVGNAFHLYLSNRDYARAAHTVGKLAYGEEASLAKKTQHLQEMSNLLQRAVDQKAPNNSNRSAAKAVACAESSRSKDSFSQVMTDEMITLLGCQIQLQDSLEVENIVGSSLIETLHKLFALYPTHPSALFKAVELAEQFEVHPRQFSWALLKVLAQTEQWQTLLVVTAAARPAIGCIPVIETLLDEDHADLAHDLLALVDAPHEREEILALIAKHRTHGGSTNDDAHATS